MSVDPGTGLAQRNAEPPPDVLAALNAPAEQSRPDGGGSGLRRKLWIEMTDGTTYTVTTAVADALRYERTYKKPLFDGFGVSALAFLGWAALRRTGQIEATTLPDFEPKIADLMDITGDAEDVDPTRTDH